MDFKKVSLLMMIVLVIGVLAACGSNNNSEGNAKEAKHINLGQIDWAEDIAVTNMWKAILEEEGYEVEFHVLDIGTQMAALENDELDIAPEIWLPVQDKSYLERYQDTVEFSEATWYDQAKVGLAVPEYVDVDSIEELNDNKDLFEGNIVGFDSGAGTMEVTEELIEDYDLDFELLPSSEPAMLTEIRQAMKAEEPIVSPLWSPHQIFSELDLKYLDDPKNVYGDTEKIHHATREGFADDFPEVATWLNNWKMDDDQIGSLMTEVVDAEDELEAAKGWVEENQDLVDEWLEK